VSYRHSRVSFPPQCFLLLLAATALIDSIMGCLLYRSPVSIDLVTQPPPASASEEVVTSASNLPCNKRVRREDAGGDLGRTEEDRRSPWLELVMSETRAEEPACPEAPTNVVSSPAVTTEAEPMQGRETTLAELPHLLLPSARSRRAMSLPPVRPLTRPAKKTRACCVVNDQPIGNPKRKV
jgi:hypothetical protein